MDFRDNKVDIYEDGIGGVALIQSMGDDLTPSQLSESELGSSQYRNGRRRKSASLTFLFERGIPLQASTTWRLFGLRPHFLWPVNLNAP